MCNRNVPDYNYDLSTAESAARTYFKVLNNNDTEYYKTICYKKRGELEPDYQKVELISIKEFKEEDPLAGRSYIDNVVDAKVFNVQFKVVLKYNVKDFIGFNGTNYKSILVVRETKDSEWKVADFGEG